ncbi:TIGR03560 family F420-dependent LLM class oxidoreductase [soil metagenome]
MKLGLQVPYFSWPDAPASIGPTFARIAKDAEDAGMSSLWVMDHFFQIEMIGPPELEMLEGYTALAFAAAHTSTIELGTLVTGVTYRHPGILMKTVTTLDVLSGGRAWLGIGAAWNEEEHSGLGVPYPRLADRFEQLEETLKIAHTMRSGDDSPQMGPHYQLSRPLNSPAPMGRLPIMVGGSGETKTLRMVAQYADACNIFDFGPGGVKAKYEVLEGHCAALGRDPAEIERTVITRMALSTDGAPLEESGEQTLTVPQAVDKLGALAEIGTQTVMFGLPNAHEQEVFELVADVAAQVNDI